MKHILYRIGLLFPLMAYACGAPGSAFAADTCHASWYGPGFDGKKMASGQRFNMHDASIVAHKTLSFGTRVRLRNLKNGKTLLAVVKDRGPYVRGRCIDVSRAGAIKLGFLAQGTARVELTVLK